MSMVPSQTDLVLQHVEEHRAWYDSNARRSMHGYNVLRTISVGATVLIPVFALVGTDVWPKVVAALLAALAAFAQGFESLHQYREHYVAWRYTAEQFEREKYEFAVRIGPYAPGASQKEPIVLLAERTEAITSQENQQWLALQQKADSTSVVKGGAGS